MTSPVDILERLQQTSLSDDTGQRRQVGSRDFGQSLGQGEDLMNKGKGQVSINSSDGSALATNRVDRVDHEVGS